MLNTSIGSLSDDMNTPNLLSIIRKYINLVRNKIVHESDKISDIVKEEILDVTNNILYFDEKILKLNLLEYIEESLTIGQTEKNLAPSEITDLANQRLQAKQHKDFILADELRNQINLL